MKSALILKEGRPGDQLRRTAEEKREQHPAQAYEGKTIYSKVREAPGKKKKIPGVHSGGG